MHEVTYVGDLRNRDTGLLTPTVRLPGKGGKTPDFPEGQYGSVTIKGARVPKEGEVLTLKYSFNHRGVRDVVTKDTTYRVDKVEHSVRPSKLIIPGLFGRYVDSYRIYLEEVPTK